MNETLFDRALTLLRTLEEESLDLICCSPPPFDLTPQQVDGSTRQSGNLIALFTPVVRACARALKPRGSLILELEGRWVSGSPLRNLFPIAAPNFWIDGPIVLPAGENRTGGEVEASLLLLEFAIRLCTEAGDRVCDPFDRSGGKRQQVANALGRHWIGSRANSSVIPRNNP